MKPNQKLELTWIGKKNRPMMEARISQEDPVKSYHALHSLASQKQIKALETQGKDKRTALFDTQDEIDRRREKLINEIEGKLKQKVSLQELFALRWRLR